MKQLFKTLPYALFALLLFVGSGIVTQAHARGGKPSIKTCKACRGIANELEDALHRRNQLRDILRNWENRYKGLTGQLGSIRELEAKLSKSKSRSLSDDIQARIKAVKTAKAKVAKFRKMVQDANANANRWQARFDACHKKHCKGERQGGRAIGMGGYLPLGLRKVHTTCLPCKPIAKKLNKKYRKIYNAERQLARLQLRLESMMSRYGTTADLKHNMTKLWSRYTAASGAARGRLHKRWQAKMDQLNEIAGAKEEIGILKDSIKDYEAEAKVLNRKLWKCVEEECGGKPDHRVGMLNGWGKTCDGQYAYAGAGLGFNNSNVAVDVTETVDDRADTARGSQNNNGVLGEVFVGYHIPISDTFFTELEAFTTFHSLSAKDLNVGNVQITRIGIQDSAGGSVGLGLDLSPTTQIFGRVGGVAGWLSVTYRDGNSLHRSLAGLLLGAGVETSINDGRWALRGEFDYVNYHSYTGSLAGGGTKKYNPRTNQVIVSAVLRLGC